MFYMPAVQEADYPVLKAAMGSAIPANYRGWLRLAAQWERVHSENGITRVEVTPTQFAAFMANAERCLDLDALLDFATFNPWHDPDLDTNSNVVAAAKM
jgi:hypothetical protein